MRVRAGFAKVLRQRSRVPAWHPDSRWYRGGDGDPGGTGVREPRRPKPTLPFDSAALDEPA